MPLFTPSIDPWRIEIVPWSPPFQSTNWATIATSGSFVSNTAMRTTVQNGSIGWKVPLAAGTWALSVIYFKSSAYGIAAAALDGASLGTIDAYAASNTFNTVTTISGITVASSAVQLLTLTVATKNASSSGFTFDLHAVSLQRTA